MTRSFQGYTEHRADAVVGLGVSAISSTPRMHWQSPTELPAWEKAVAAGEFAVERGIELDQDDRIRRAVIGCLMCDSEVDLGRIASEHHVDGTAYFENELAEIQSLGDLVHYDAGTSSLRATELGRLLIRNVCMVFDRYNADATRSATPRFSPTI